MNNPNGIEIGKTKAELDIDIIAQKAAENHGWSDTDIEYAKEWYARHIYLAKKYPGMPLAAISKKGDELWHQHILDTKKYASDCQRILGELLQHQPIYGKPTSEHIKVHNDTVALYEREFGTVADDVIMTSGDYSYGLPRQTAK